MGKMTRQLQQETEKDLKYNDKNQKREKMLKIN